MLLPDQNQHGAPVPTGTGFFVSRDGWFLTAAHVVTEDGQPDGPVRSDLADARLAQEARIFTSGTPSRGCQHVSVEHVLPRFDLAVLRVDLAANSKRAWLKSRTGFPELRVGTRCLEEAEPVYAFGYPLSQGTAESLSGGSIISLTKLCPRTTSAVVSSTFEESRMVSSPGDARVYVLDKALNYGNSGGPIVATETGLVHALCSRFQPTPMPQIDPDGKEYVIRIPSLYGVTSSLSNEPILELFKSLNIPTDDA